MQNLVPLFVKSLLYLLQVHYTVIPNKCMFELYVLTFLGKVMHTIQYIPGTHILKLSFRYLSPMGKTYAYLTYPAVVWRKKNRARTVLNTIIIFTPICTTVCTVFCMYPYHLPIFNFQVQAITCYMCRILYRQNIPVPIVRQQKVLFLIKHTRLLHVS